MKYVKVIKFRFGLMMTVILVIMHTLYTITKDNIGTFKLRISNIERFLYCSL